MANLNSGGSILHGLGGGQASIDNVPFSPGTAGGWVDDRTAFFADAGLDWTVALLDVPTGSRRPAIADANDPYYGLGGNTLCAGGGVWAAWLNGVGLYASTGFRAPAAGLLAVGPDGTIGYKPDYQSNGPTMARELDGAEWIITPGHAADLMLLGNRCAIWQEAQEIRVCGLPVPVQVGPAWRPQAFPFAGWWWIAYWCDALGVVLHPIDALEGYVIAPAPAACWHYGRLLDSGALRFALARAEGEQPGEVRGYYVDFSQPVIALEPAPPVIEPPPVVVEPPPVIEPPPIVVEPTPPEPTPPPVITPQPPEVIAMLAAYNPTILPGFKPGTEHDNGDGTLSVEKPNGKYLCVTPEGKVEERDTPGGAWESFKRGANCIIAERDGGDKGRLIYVLMTAEAIA